MRFRWTVILVTALMLSVLSGENTALCAQTADESAPDPEASVCASGDSLTLRIYFPKSIRLYYGLFAGNGASLREFVERYRERFPGCPIVISSGASPEGTSGPNRILAEKRAQALLEQLRKRLDLPDSLYTRGACTTEYPGQDIPPEEYPFLRYAEAVAAVIPEGDIPAVPSPAPVRETSSPDTSSVEEAAVPVPVAEPVAEPEVEPAQTPVVSPGFIRRPLFALKTNLLFDALTAVNVELEVPIARRFSIAGEVIFPDWVDRTGNTYCLQASLKTVEGRVWLGDRMAKEKLTGHFLGAYYTWGNFDYQPFREDGFRCYNGWAAGVSYGFAHPINRAQTLRMEYSIGVGYAFGDYCRYQREADGTIIASKEEWHYNASFFPMPTRAKVSLVWMICYKKKVR